MKRLIWPIISMMVVTTSLYAQGPGPAGLAPGAVPMPTGAPPGAAAGLPPGAAPMPAGAPPVGAAGLPPMATPGSPAPTSAVPNGAAPGATNPSPAAPVVPAIDLGALAKLAFKNGREKEAWLLAQADAVANPEVAKKITEECHWADLIKQPSIGARWGIGLNIVLGKEPPARGTNQKGKKKVYEGDPQSFGTTVTVLEGQAARLGTEKARVPGNLNEKLFFYTGDLGEKILNSLVERARQGKLGSRVKASFDGVVGEYDFKAYSVAGKGGNANQAGMLFKHNYAAPGGSPGTPTFVEAGPLMPSVYFVGTNTDPEKAKDLLEKAEREGIDYYFQFDVAINPAKEARSLTEVKVSLLHIPRVSDAKPADPKKVAKAKTERIHTTKTLANRKVEDIRKAGKEDPVDTEVRALFAEVDKRIELKDPPGSITSDMVAGRCDKLADIGADAVSPLRPMMEIRYWHAKGMIDDGKLEELYAKFVGADSAKELLTSDDANKRADVIAKFLPVPSSQDLATYAKSLTGGAPATNGFPAMATNGPPGAPGAGGFPNPAAGSGPPGGAGPGGYPNPAAGTGPPNQGGLGAGPGGYPKPGATGTSPPPGVGAGPMAPPTGTSGGSPPPTSSPTGTAGGSAPPASSPTGSSGGSPPPSSSPTPGSGPPS